MSMRTSARKGIRSAWYAFRYSQGREMKVFFDGVYITI